MTNGAKKFTISVPSHSSMEPKTATSLVGAAIEMTRRGWELTYSGQIGGAIVENVRASQVHEFLKSPPEQVGNHLVLIDSDVVFHWSLLENLLTSGFDVCGATYASKKLNFEAVAKAIAAGRDPRVEGSLLQFRALQTEANREVVLSESQNDYAFVEVEALPTGFLCLSREALLKMCDGYSDLTHTQKDGEVLYDLFDCIREGGVKYGEDYSFCRRWRAIGGKVHMALGVNVGHVGKYTYHGAMRDFFPDVDRLFDRSPDADSRSLDAGELR